MQGLGSGSALADILQQALEQPDITFEEWQLYKYEVTMVLRVPDMCRQDQGDLDAVPGYNYAQLLGVRIDATLDEVHHSYSATLPATACCPEDHCWDHTSYHTSHNMPAHMGFALALNLCWLCQPATINYVLQVLSAECHEPLHKGLT